VVYKSTAVVDMPYTSIFNTRSYLMQWTAESGLQTLNIQKNGHFWWHCATAFSELM